MKYFTGDLWEKLQTYNTRKKAQELWDENCKLYKSELEKIREVLPKGFLKIFYKENGFHDYIIRGIEIESVKRKTKPELINVTVKLCSGDKQYFLLLKNIEKTIINISDMSYCIRGRLTWGYSEFEVLKNGKIKLSILCDVKNELEFVFNKISIEQS